MNHRSTIGLSQHAAKSIKCGFRYTRETKIYFLFLMLYCKKAYNIVRNYSGAPCPNTLYEFKKEILKESKINQNICSKTFNKDKLAEMLE